MPLSESSLDAKIAFLRYCNWTVLKEMGNNILNSSRWWIVTLHNYIPLTHNCWGEKLVSVVTGWLFHSLQNSLRAPLIKSRYTKWRQKRCTSLHGLKTLLLSRYKKIWRKRETTILFTFLQSLYILWLCIEVPVIILPLFNPRVCSMYLPTS